MDAKSFEYDLIAFLLFFVVTGVFIAYSGKRKYFSHVESRTNSDHDAKKLEIEQPIPKSVNYHFTRKCNYECGFCFHTAKTSYMLSLEDAKRGLRMLKNAGIVKYSGCVSCSLQLLQEWKKLILVGVNRFFHKEACIWEKWLSFAKMN